MDWTYNTIWLDRLPPGRLATIEFERGRAMSKVIAGATYYRIQKFKTKEPGFHDLGGITTAEYLEVNHSNIPEKPGLRVFTHSGPAADVRGLVFFGKKMNSKVKKWEI